MVNLKMKNANEVRLMIAKEGHTIKTFARKIGVSHSYISQIINGVRVPSPVVAKKISNGLGMELEDIFLVKVVAESETITNQGVK